MVKPLSLQEIGNFFYFRQPLLALPLLWNNFHRFSLRNKCQFYLISVLFPLDSFFMSSFRLLLKYCAHFRNRSSTDSKFELHFVTFSSRIESLRIVYLWKWKVAMLPWHRTGDLRGNDYLFFLVIRNSLSVQLFQAISRQRNCGSRFKDAQHAYAVQ